MLKVLVFLAVATATFGQDPASVRPVPASPAAGPASDARLDQVLKAVDDLMWHTKLGDIAEVDKVAYTSLPPHRARNPSAPGATNPLIIHAYTFIPKIIDQPLIVNAHGGVHANSDTGAAHIIRELVQQGYSVISTDYRGSTGYGRSFYEEIDYGGREV